MFMVRLKQFATSDNIFGSVQGVNKTEIRGSSVSADIPFGLSCVLNACIKINSRKCQWNVLVHTLHAKCEG